MLCEIDLKKYIPQANDGFAHLRCESFQELAVELHRIIQLIEDHDEDAFYSIPIIISQTNEKYIPNTLLRKIKEQNRIVFDVQIDDPELQKKFREAYLESQKKWYRLQIQKQKNQAEIDLSAFCGTPTPLLSYVHQEQHPTENFIEWQPEIPLQQLQRIDNATSNSTTLIVLIETLKDAHPDYQIAIDALKDCLNDLYLQLGEDGLCYRLDQLKSFDKEQLIHLQQTLFQPSQVENISTLAHPNMEYYLNIIQQWPKNLFHYWLNIYQASTTPISMLQSILEMQKFWEMIQDEQPNIPRLSSSNKQCFSTLLRHMTECFERCEKTWKKIQLIFLFELDWSNPQDIFDLQSSPHVHWVAPIMFNKEHRLNSAYHYLAKNLDYHAERFSEIQRTVSNYSFASEQLDYLCFLYCLTPMLSQEKLHTMLKKPISPSSLQQLKLIPKTQMFSAKTFEMMHQSNNFDQLIALHALWITKTQNSEQDLWAQWMNFYAKVPESFTLNLKDFETQSITEIALNCILQALNGSPPALKTLQKLQNWDPDFQKKIVQIFFSYQFNPSKKGMLDVDALLSDRQLVNNTKVCFAKHLPEEKFLYLSEATEYRLVLNIMKNMLDDLAKVLSDYTNPNKKIHLGPISSSLSSCLNPAFSQKIDEVKQQVEYANRLIQSLEIEHTPEAFNRLLSQFDPLEQFIQSLLTMPLQGNLANWLTQKSIINQSLIAGLDSRLQEPGKNFKHLFASMVDQYGYLPQQIKDEYFRLDILKLLSAVKTEEKVLEILMNEHLIKEIAQKIPVILDEKKHSDLLIFLGNIQLNAQDIEQFFQRIKSIEYVNQQWPTLEKLLQSQEIDSDAIWAICAKHQCIHDKPYASSHWTICFDLIKILIHHQNPIETFDQVLQAKKAFPHQLDFNGKVFHPHWHFTLSQLEKDLKADIAKSASFFLMLEHAMTHHLKQATPYNYQQFSAIFQKLHSDARHQILTLVNIQDAEKIPFIAIFLSRIQKELASAPSPTSIKLLEKIIMDPSLMMHLQHLEPIFAWLEKEKNFPWSNIILEDSECQLTTILELMEAFQKMPIAWQKTYPAQQLASTPPAPAKIQQSLVSQFFHWLTQPRITDSRPTTQISQDALQLAKDGWRLWQRPFRPSVHHIIQVLKNPKRSALEEFDQWPLGKLLPCQYTLEQQLEVLQNLESHTHSWDDDMKEKLGHRFANILMLFDAYHTLTITQLLTRFQDIQQKDCIDIDDENQLIAILKTLYFKNIGKQIYPTQVIALLMALEFGHKNMIFEIDTGEGKSIINALLAILKWIRKTDNIVMVRTAHQELVFQDFYQKKHQKLFELLNIHSHELLSIDDLQYFRPNGIYYTTHLHLQMIQSTHFILQRTHFDLIVDEVDEILDKGFPLSLAKPLAQLDNHSWLYEDINQFVDHHLSDRFTEAQWIIKAKQFVFEKNKENFLQLKYLRRLKLPQKIWKKLIQSGFISRHYIQLELKDYLIKKQSTGACDSHQIIPYFQGQLIADFQFGVDGLVQCLAKRLEKIKGISIVVPPFAESVNYLNPFDYKNITSLIGVSGSNGKVLELNQLCLSFYAQSYRIGRYKKKNLQYLPTIIEPNEAAQIAQIVRYINQFEQPFILFCENIQSAQRFFNAIQAKITHPKTIQLITGQETDEERKNWLYNQELRNFAGREHCITIGIADLLGRGTDIVTQDSKKEGLFEIKTYIEESERKETQIDGRPARDGAKGKIISILNQQHINEKARNLKLSDIHSQSLPLLKSLIQKKYIILSTKKREIEQRRLWCWSHLSSFLEQTLMEPQALEVSRAHLLSLFEKKWHEIQHHTPKDQTFYTRFINELWEKISLRIHSLHHEHKIVTSSFFQAQLTLSDWQEIINPDLQTTKFFMNGAKKIAKITEKSHSEPRFPEIGYLNNFVGKLQTRGHLSWVNIPAQTINRYLFESYEIYKENPRFENFKYFYESLLMAKKLYELQKKDSFWRVDFWLTSLNLLFPWIELEHKLTEHLKINNHSGNAIFSKIQKKLDKLFGSYLRENSSTSYFSIFQVLINFIELILTYIQSVMFFFFPNIKTLEIQLQRDIQLFQHQMTEQNLHKLHQTFIDVLIFYTKNEASSWCNLSKYYWQSHFKAYQISIEKYFEELSEIILIPDTLKIWLNDCSINADLRLQCLGNYLFIEETLYRESNKFGIFKNHDPILSQLNEQYSSTKPNNLIQLHEFGRFFKNRDKHPLGDNAYYIEYAKRLITQHIQTPEVECDMRSTSIRFKTLEKALLAAESNRQFLSLLT